MTDPLKALAAIDGLTIGDCLRFFDSKATDRDREIANMVDTNDELEVDNSITSEGEDNGSWVLAWTWVSFSGTPFDKDYDEQGNLIVEAT